MTIPGGRQDRAPGNLLSSALVAISVCAAAPVAGAESAGDRWALAEGTSIRWDVAGDALPHSDFIEQGGRKAGQKVWYTVAADGSLSVERDVVWPGLRIFPNDTHGSLVRHFGAEATPQLSVDGLPLGAVRVVSATLDGTLTFRGTAGKIEIRRVTFPSIDRPATIDRWTLRNAGSAAVTVTVAPLQLSAETRGPYGVNLTTATHDAPASTVLKPGAEMSFAVVFAGRLPTDAAPAIDAAAEEA
ncbi:MAG: hypothetical protein K8T20_13025, partial [Planctomycetes bacterium]|nr:hypothetical protein [Planctomycetota bacterium]